MRMGKEVSIQNREKKLTKSELREAILKEKTYKPLEELNLMNNFLFHTIVTQGEDGEEFCRIILSNVLGREIRKVRVIAQQSILGFDTNQHGIRLDAYVEDVSDLPEMVDAKLSDIEIVPDIYDIEPNNTYEKESLPKRMRYYHGLIDTKHLNTGVYYDKLPRVIIIVILPYDPFGLNRMVYTVKNQCVEAPEVFYEDGAIKIFLYTKGTEGNPSQALVDMLKYLEDTSVENITNKDINTIHKFVEKAKHRKEVGIQYMRLWEENIQMKKEAREAGLAEGRAEGRAEGLAEGLAEGRAEGIAEAKSDSMRILVETYQKLKQSQEAAKDALVEEYLVPDEEAEELVKKYWK